MIKYKNLNACLNIGENKISLTMARDCNLEFDFRYKTNNLEKLLPMNSWLCAKMGHFQIIEVIFFPIDLIFSLSSKIQL